jgi:glutamate racemase
MPHERFIYWSDSAFAPYGERSDAFLIDRCHFITEQLIVKAIVKSVVSGLQQGHSSCH